MHMTAHNLLVGGLAGFAGDTLLVWLSWRYVVRPRLHRLVRDLAREEIKLAARLRPMPRSAETRRGCGERLWDVQEIWTSPQQRTPPIRGESQ